MLTVSGVGIISPNEKIIEKPLETRTIFQFYLVTKDPYQQKRHYIKVQIFVQNDKTEEAREKLKPGNILQIRIGELTGIKNNPDFPPFMAVNTKLNWIEVMKAIPQKEVI